jgi:hypothetical protein
LPGPGSARGRRGMPSASGLGFAWHASPSAACAARGELVVSPRPPHLHAARPPRRPRTRQAAGLRETQSAAIPAESSLRARCTPPRCGSSPPTHPACDPPRRSRVDCPSGARARPPRRWPARPRRAAMAGAGSCTGTRRRQRRTPAAADPSAPEHQHHGRDHQTEHRGPGSAAEPGAARPKRCREHASVF